MDARFDDGKEDGALRTIGEVAQALGIKQHVLRYWEQQFPMLQPLKRSGGRRYYRAADIALVETIDRLVNREGYTLKGAMKALSSKDTLADSASHQGAVADGAGAGEERPSQPPATLPFTSELPQDGGLEAFFGKQPDAPQNVATDSAETEIAEPEPAPAEAKTMPVPPPVPPELLDQLKAIRARLSEALAA